jgi:hypothetical protein
MATPATIFALGIDPATHTGIALVRLDVRTGEAELVGVWAVYGDGQRAWCGRALAALLDVAQRAQAAGIGDRALPAWYERPAPARPGEVAWDPCPMAMRAGAVLMAAQVAGLRVAYQPVSTSQWTALTRVPPGKRGDGSHRIEEAAARIELAGADLAALDHCRVDCAEAALIALACARAEAERLMGGKQIPLAATSNFNASTARGQGCGPVWGGAAPSHFSPRQE